MSSGKRYFWLKLQDGFFGSKRIKKLRRMAGGDTYVIIYLKMQLMAMKQDGYLTFTGLESDFADELALDLDEEPDDVRVTLAYLISCGLAETSDNVSFYFPWAVENTGSETASTIRSRECRARKALQCNTDATLLQRECSVEIDIEKEKDRETEDITPILPVCVKGGAGGETDLAQKTDFTQPIVEKPVENCEDDFEAKREAALRKLRERKPT